MYNNDNYDKEENLERGTKFYKNFKDHSFLRLSSSMKHNNNNSKKYTHGTKSTPISPKLSNGNNSDFCKITAATLKKQTPNSMTLDSSFLGSQPMLSSTKTQNTYVCRLLK